MFQFLEMLQILLVFFPFFLKMRSEPLPLDLAEQHGSKNHHGHGDIVELWEENQNNLKMRYAVRTTNRWTMEMDSGDEKYVIPYTITGKFTNGELEVISGAMEKIARNTCVKFMPRNGRGHRDFIDLQNEYGEGCYASVGRLPGRNIVMLESTEEETCVTNATVLHELFHKLGLWHEHMRADRDKYIRIHFRNIPFYLHAQFRTVPTDRRPNNNHSLQYNFRSLMHYGEHAFAEPHNAVSMETRKRKFQKVIGTATDASRGEWIKVCAMYNCTECMGRAFDEEQEAKQFQEQLEREEEEDEYSEGEEEDDCLPLPGCGITITRHSHPTALWKIACCEPCSQCVPEASVCDTPHALPPHVFKYDCCGRCRKNSKTINDAKF